MEKTQAAASFAAGSLLFLNGADLESLAVSPAEVISVIEESFKSKAGGLAELPPKPTVHPRPEGFLRALPGCMKRPDVVGLKWVSAYATNRKAGLPTVCGLVILNDPETGFPVAILEGNRITAWRTAGVSAMAAGLLARKDASVLAICGAGVQGGAHLDFLPQALPDLKEVRIFAPDPRKVNRFLETHGPRHPGITLKGVSSPRQAVRDADVVVTAAPMTKTPLGILQAEDLAAGALCLPLDLDSYFAASAFAAADLFYCDDAEQFFALKAGGRFREIDRIDGDYGQLLTRRVSGRRDASQRIMAISVGIALGDLAVAHFLYRKAVAAGCGTRLNL
jgi:ornithine cyclodeaminase/alanine dehydrogenase